MGACDEWVEVSDGSREPTLRDPDRTWANIKQRLAERRRYQLAPARSLPDLRRSCAVSQEKLAVRLGLKQARVSRLEAASDVRLSTLRAYVAALEGTLILLARFPGRDVQLTLYTP